eukprot:6491732-Amphidinium_carterae.1
MFLALPRLQRPRTAEWRCQRFAQAPGQPICTQARKLHGPCVHTPLQQGPAIGSMPCLHITDVSAAQLCLQSEQLQKVWVLKSKKLFNKCCTPPIQQTR